MLEVGYALSSEERSPRQLIELAKRAEETGFSFAMISDHYHPWIDRQGQSPFVWAVVGAIAEATERLRLGTGVTCPIQRIHPAIVAQAAATAAAMMPGRFFLGVGSGENLNEHVVGGRWPSPPIRLEMLEEAIEILRLLWQGDFQSFRGRYFEVDNARVYTLPDQPIPVFVAAGAPEPHVARLREFADAGFDHVSVHQVGPHQEGFFRFYAERVLPELRRSSD
jgi:G6PDH family F420-dependent oxidoreductase